jgi:Rieske Fe-S protein
MSQSEMPSSFDSSSDLDRRGWFRAVIGIVVGAITSVLGVVVGGAVLAPSFAAKRETWLPAGRLRDLEDDVPTPVTVRLVRQDGYYEAVEQQVVYLIKSDSGGVRAMSSTCTHLGCRTSYDPKTKQIKCPCHGGVYSADGTVLAGPPPRPLPQVAVRVDGPQVFVQL